MASTAKDRIAYLVGLGLRELSEQNKLWTRNHLVDPRQEPFSLEADGDQVALFWLVTDHTGKNDSSYRIVFDEQEDSFGLVVELASGTQWFLGIYGTFREALENM